MTHNTVSLSGGVATTAFDVLADDTESTDLDSMAIDDTVTHFMPGELECGDWNHSDATTEPPVDPCSSHPIAMAEGLRDPTNDEDDEDDFDDDDDDDEFDPDDDFDDDDDDDDDFVDD